MLTLEVLSFGRNNCVEKAKVSKDVLKGQTVFYIDNAQNFFADDYILIGRIGGNAGRIYQIDSLSDNAVTLKTSLGSSVERGTEITKLFGTKIKLYSAPYQTGVTPSIDSFTAIDGGIVDIDPDQETTFFNDPNGSDQIWYRYTYLNATTSLETSLADSTPIRDTSGTDYATIDDIRKEAGFTDVDTVTDQDIARKRAAAQGRINGMLSGKYDLPFTQPISPTIQDLTVRLAAGLLMISEYGTFDGQDKSKGEKKRDDAIAELKDLQSGASVITDLQAISTVPTNAGSFSSSFGVDAAPRMFSTEDSHDPGSRQY